MKPVLEAPSSDDHGPDIGPRAKGSTPDVLVELKRNCQLNPADGLTHKALGIHLQKLEKSAHAETAYREALRICPGDAEIWANLGVVVTARGESEEGCRYLEQAASLAPDVADIHYNLGNGYLDANHLQNAQLAYERALRLDPDHYEALISLGSLLKQQACRNRAETCYQHAIEIAPERPEAYANYANLLCDKGACDAAETVLSDGLAHVPHSADLHYNLGNILRVQEAYPEALAAYRQALQIDPGHAYCHWNKALTHLANGEYRRGWREYEWRQRKADWVQYYPHQHATPLWQGEEIHNKTLLVHDEQGFGDTIQFSRYLPLVRQRCKRLVFETRLPLMPLFEGQAHIDNLVHRPVRQSPSLHWDLHVPLLSLPHLLGTDVDSIPATIPYLVPDAKRLASFASVLDHESLNIGLVWAGNPGHHNDHHRSFKYTDFAPLVEGSAYNWHSLQLGTAAQQLPRPPTKTPIRHWEDHLHSFADTAALMWALDLIISVDTSIAHLGGALGKPLWLVLPAHNVDWRWQLNRRTSPWYPTITLFRSSPDANEPAVIDCLAKKLQTFSQQASSI